MTQSAERFLPHRDLVSATLDRLVPEHYPNGLSQAMRYYLLPGGKRLRPLLCIAACELHGGQVEASLHAACALEMVHTMSLIHDDLPAMDDARTRRGRAALHVVFGEAMAVLAGDALLALAFETLVTHASGVPPERALRVAYDVAHSLAVFGLAGGQAVDLATSRTAGSALDLDFIHYRKTAILFEAAASAGAVLAGAADAEVRAMAAFGKSFGMAFQAADDVNDLGPGPNGSDERFMRLTSAALLSQEEANRRLQGFAQEARQVLEPYGKAGAPLRALIEPTLNRPRRFGLHEEPPPTRARPSRSAGGKSVEQ